MCSYVGCMLCYAKSLQSCPTLCDPIDSSPLGSSVPGILQARILECVAISFSNAWKWKVKGKSLSRVRLLVTPWTAAYQAPPSMDFPGKSTGVGCHCLLRVGCIYILNCYIFFLDWSFDHCPSLSLFMDFISKSSLSVKYCCSCFLLVSICMK